MAERRASAWAGVKIFGAIDWLLKRVEPFFPASVRRRAIAAAEAFVTERLNGEDGLGAIYPAMANTVLMYDALGYPPDDPHLVAARRSIEKLLVIGKDEAYCQPCLSPVWDTALAAHALLEAGGEAGAAPVRAALDWLAPLQVLDVKGDWAVQRPDVRPGGWAFQYANPHYPDLDDTAVVAMAMDRADRGGVTGRARRPFASQSPERANGSKGLQSRNGAWAAFDADNTHHYLNHIPFADHGALLDPPTADVTARCVSMLAQLGETRATSPVLKRGIDALIADQEEDGSWFGRWGMNYIYGTWSALCALAIAGQDPQSAPVRRAVAWLERIQNPDGGWGESGASYRLDYKGYEPAPSTASQTAWALAWADGGGRSRSSGRRPRNRLSRRDSRGGRLLERTVPHRDRFSARLLPALSRLFEVFSALGARPLSQSQARQQPGARVRHVKAEATPGYGNSKANPRFLVREIGRFAAAIHSYIVQVFITPADKDGPR